MKYVPVFLLFCIRLSIFLMFGMFFMIWEVMVHSNSIVLCLSFTRESTKLWSAACARLETVEILSSAGLTPSWLCGVRGRRSQSSASTRIQLIWQRHRNWIHDRLIRDRMRRCDFVKTSTFHDGLLNHLAQSCDYHTQVVNSEARATPGLASTKFPLIVVERFRRNIWYDKKFFQSMKRAITQIYIFLPHTCQLIEFLVLENYQHRCTVSTSIAGSIFHTWC